MIEVDTDCRTTWNNDLISNSDDCLSRINEKISRFSKPAFQHLKFIGATGRIEFEAKIEWDGKETKASVSAQGKVEDDRGNYAELKVEKNSDGKTKTTVKGGAEIEMPNNSSNKK